MRQTDQMLARYASEIEDRQNFIDGLVEDAEKNGRDLSPQEMELLTRAQERLTFLSGQVEPLKEARRISSESANQVAEMHKFITEARTEKPQEVQYRSAGQYAIDMWRGALGDNDARERMDLYNRAAAHQTTGDNPGLLPVPIVDGVLNFVDESRSLVTWLGPQQLPGATWNRPKVTQHTSVATQSAEKAELASQKMTITKLVGTATTWGGYVNVSRQNIDFTQPGIMDTVINDLAAQYAIQTEAYAFTTFDAAAASGLALPTGANTADQLAASLWDAASKIYTATKGQGRIGAFMGPDMLAKVGPVFPPIPAAPSQSPGLSAGAFNTGLVGNIAGIPIYVSAGCGTSRILVFSSAAAEVYEDRIGSLQVVEPSVLGVQVAYAGYFSAMPVEATGIVKIVKTP